jgi:hypothetical protein
VVSHGISTLATPETAHLRSASHLATQE